MRNKDFYIIVAISCIAFSSFSSFSYAEDSGFGNSDAKNTLSSSPKLAGTGVPILTEAPTGMVVKGAIKPKRIFKLKPDALSSLQHQVEVQKLKNELQKLKDENKMRALPIMNPEFSSASPYLPSTIPEGTVTEANVNSNITIQSIHLDKKGKLFAYINIDGSSMNVRAGDKISKDLYIKKVTARKVLVKEFGKDRQIGFDQDPISTDSTSTVDSTSPMI